MVNQPNTFTVLRDFILSRMRMSHIYQPIMLRTLLTHSGKATIRQIAAEFLARDESQLEYYEEITKGCREKCWPATVSSSETEIRIVSNPISVS